MIAQTALVRLKRITPGQGRFPRSRRPDHSKVILGIPRKELADNLLSGVGSYLNCRAVLHDMVLRSRSGTT